MKNKRQDEGIKKRHKQDKDCRFRKYKDSKGAEKTQAKYKEMQSKRKRNCSKGKKGILLLRSCERLAKLANKVSRGIQRTKDDRTATERRKVPKRKQSDKGAKLQRKRL